MTSSLYPAVNWPRERALLGSPELASLLVLVNTAHAICLSSKLRDTQAN